MNNAIGKLSAYNKKIADFEPRICHIMAIVPAARPAWAQLICRYEYGKSGQNTPPDRVWHDWILPVLGYGTVSVTSWESFPAYLVADKMGPCWLCDGRINTDEIRVELWIGRKPRKGQISSSSNFCNGYSYSKEVFPDDFHGFDWIYGSEE
jgi:hypothetical protein